MNLSVSTSLNKPRCLALLALLLLVYLYVSQRSSRHVLDPTTVSLRSLLDAALEAARVGGQRVVSTPRNKLQIGSKGKTAEGAEDSVTNADFDSHCAMTYVFEKRTPTVRVVSEEAKTTCSDTHSPSESVDTEKINVEDEFVEARDITVWIDPLDATQEYTEQLYQYVTTMVCIAVKGRPVIGVIHKPFENETSWAWVGKRRSPDIETLELGQVGSKPKFITSRSHKGKVEETIRNAFKDSGAEIIAAGGAGYKVLELTKGHADAYIHVTAIKKWDICAGNAIVDALGGKMTNRLGELIDYGSGSDPVNSNGLIVALRNHEVYLNGFRLDRH